jgi:hypothetical protein
MEGAIEIHTTMASPEAMDGFTYQGLIGQSEIRLLRLEPDIGDMVLRG